MLRTQVATKKAMDLGQKKVAKKHKRMMHDTSVVDDHPATKSSTIGGSAKPSSAKSSKKMKLSKVDGLVNAALLSDGSTYSYPLFVKGIADSLLLQANHKGLAKIGPVLPAEWSMAHIY